MRGVGATWRRWSAFSIRPSSGVGSSPVSGIATDVMQTLRERYEQGFAKGELEFRQGGEDAVVVVSHPSAIGGSEWPEETATLMRFREGKVVSMQDYRTEAEALAAL